MASFIDDEASEASSSDEELENDSDDSRIATSKSKGKSKKKSQTKSKPKKSRDVIDSSEEEEDDEEDEEEMKDLINDEEEEEEDESDSDAEGAGTKRSHDYDEDGSSSLEDDDLDLIKENTGVEVVKKKKYKRIRTISDDDSEEEVDTGKRIQNELFGSAAPLDSDDEDVNVQKSRPTQQDLDLDVDNDEESDSDDGFIVDDNDQPIYKKPKKRGARYTDTAMQQAQETFGVDFDFDDLEEDDYGDDYEDGYGDDYEEEDENGEPRPRKKKTGRKSIYDVYEPAELARSHMTDFDQQIRAKDEPERFQLRQTALTEAEDEELEKEAEWIFQVAFDQPIISRQGPMKNHDPIAGKISEIIKPEIKYALSCIRNEKLEVSFIAAYRREYVPTISKSFDDTRNLWTIYKYDEQWCRLQASKKNLLNLYLDMRTYIDTKVSEDQRMRKITDYDLERVHNIRTFHDLEDSRLHFKLYYSTLVAEMKIFNLEKTIAEKKTAKEQRKAAKEAEAAAKAARAAERGDDEQEPAEEEQEEDAEAEADKEEDTDEVTEEEKLYKRLSKFKISSTRDIYQRCRQDNIGSLVQKFGLTPEQFGENLRDDYQRNYVTPHHTRPLDEAANYLGPNVRFPTSEAILKAATYMFSREISSDPLIRQTVRKYYFENAVINVKPTLLGVKEIDENHPCYRFKFLRNKPVTSLEGEQFLHLTNAERDKLLEIKFSIEPVDTTDPRKNLVSPYYESLKALYYSDLYSIAIKEWNDQREESIRSALDKYLLPCFEKQLREKLVREAQDYIIRSCGIKLHEWLSVAPYAPDPTFDEYDEFELRNGTRICGFSFAPEGDAPCFAAIVDAEGELIDHVRLPNLCVRKRPDRMNALERENQAKDRVKLKQFIIGKKPHAVALVADTIQTKYICQNLAQILDELHEDDGMPLIPIKIVDNQLSSVYMGLKRANDEFPDFPPLLLQAISAARKLSDPLIEYAKLCTADNDIACIRFHSLQDDLPKEEFINSLYQEFVTVTNAVGVDPNRAIAHQHTSDVMQFVAGLGPRKVAHLMRSIKKLDTGGQLVNREQLVDPIGMTAVLYMNCSGFLKLDTDTLSEYYPDAHITPMDSTRIHPQSYGLAKKIANDALDYDDQASEEQTANAIEEILDCAEKLDELDLNAFARELDEVQNQGKKAFTLQNIREEFQCRYKDHRVTDKNPSQEAIFTMLTKETTETFYMGKLITCQVVAIPRKKPNSSQLDMANPVKLDDSVHWRCPFCLRSDFQDLSVVWNHFDTNDCPGYAIGVRCQLDNGLTGFIPTKYLSDKEITDPSERVQIGQTIHARVLKVDTEKFSCDLTCRTSDLLDREGKLKPIKDQHYDEASEAQMKQELEAKSRRAARRPYCKRVIVHPAFENIDYKACEKKLATMEQGAAIIRPSSAGQTFLTLSWKVAEGINAHINIKEEGKANAFSLGQQLFIEGESYEDLDEIIARYVQPMASFARDILNHKYCIKLPDGIDEEVALQNTLFIEKQATQCFPYRFCPSRKRPGKFLFGYIPKNKPRIEYMTVTPTGIRFRQLYFKNLLSLISWFKNNWNKFTPAYPNPTPAMGYDAVNNQMGMMRQSYMMRQ